MFILLSRKKHSVKVLRGTSSKHSEKFLATVMMLSKSFVLPQKSIIQLSEEDLVEGSKLSPEESIGSGFQLRVVPPVEGNEASLLPSLAAVRHARKNLRRQDLLSCASPTVVTSQLFSSIHGLSSGGRNHQFKSHFLEFVNNEDFSWNVRGFNSLSRQRVIKD